MFTGVNIAYATCITTKIVFILIGRAETNVKVVLVKTITVITMVWEIVFGFDLFISFVYLFLNKRLVLLFIYTYT